MRSIQEQTNARPQHLPSERWAVFSMKNIHQVKRLPEKVVMEVEIR
jgi:hypothetical protein